MQYYVTFYTLTIFIAYTFLHFNSSMTSSFQIKRQINLPSREEDRRINCTRDLFEISKEQSRVIVMYAE